MPNGQAKAIEGAAELTEIEKKSNLFKLRATKRGLRHLFRRPVGGGSRSKKRESHVEGLEASKMRELERLQKHERVTETVKANLAKKKAVYEKRLALITLILQKPTLKKERRIIAT